MTKKKDEYDEPPQKAQPAPVKAEVKRYYRPVMWKDIKEVCRCEECGQCRDTQDEIILHILLHYPPKEQEKLFNKLIGEK